MAETGVLLDRRGEPVGPAIAWHDVRGTDEARAIASELGRETVRRADRPAGLAAVLARQAPLAALARAGRGGGGALARHARVDRALARRAPTPRSCRWRRAPACSRSAIARGGRRRWTGSACRRASSPSSCPRARRWGTSATRCPRRAAPSSPSRGTITSRRWSGRGRRPRATSCTRRGPPTSSCAASRSRSRTSGSSRRSPTASRWGGTSSPSAGPCSAATSSTSRSRRCCKRLGVNGQAEREALGAAAAELGPGERGTSPAHVWRAALEAGADLSAATLARSDAVGGPRTRIVGTGGGVRGAAARAVKEERLGAIEWSPVQEATARGAALLAGVAAGAEIGDLLSVRGVTSASMAPSTVTLCAATAQAVAAARGRVGAGGVRRDERGRERVARAGRVDLAHGRRAHGDRVSARARGSPRRPLRGSRTRARPGRRARASSARAPRARRARGTRGSPAGRAARSARAPPAASRGAGSGRARAARRLPARRRPCARRCAASGSPKPMLDPETWIQSASRAARSAAATSIASAAEPRTEKKKSRPPRAVVGDHGDRRRAAGGLGEDGGVDAVALAAARAGGGRRRPSPTAPASATRAPRRAATDAKIAGAPLQNGPCQVPGRRDLAVALGPLELHEHLPDGQDHRPARRPWVGTAGAAVSHRVGGGSSRYEFVVARQTACLAPAKSSTVRR